MKWLNRLPELVTNVNGRLSTSDTLLVLSFVATSLVFIKQGWDGTLNDTFIIAYLGAWVAQSQGTKLQRKEIKKDEPTHE